VTEPEAGPLAPNAIAEALARNPDAAVLVFPREDGQYASVASDILGLLEEADVRADYATDPMATGVYIQKSADIVLPWILVIVQTLQTTGGVANTVEGLLTMIRWIVGRQPGAKVELRLALTRRPGGGETRKLELIIGRGGLDDQAERTIRDAIDAFVSE